MWEGDTWGGAWGHTWAGSWGLTYEAAQEDLSPVGRSSFVKFRPIQRGAAVLASVAADGRVYRISATGGVGRVAARSQAAAAQLGVLVASSGSIQLHPKGKAHIAAAAVLRGCNARGRPLRLNPAAGAVIAPFAVTATSYLRRLGPEAAGTAEIRPHAIGTWLAAVEPVAVQNLTDEELIGLFLQARRRSPLTGRVNHL